MGGRDGGFWGMVGVEIYENPGFPNPGFCNLWPSKAMECIGTKRTTSTMPAGSFNCPTQPQPQRLTVARWQAGCTSMRTSSPQ